MRGAPQKGFARLISRMRHLRPPGSYSRFPAPEQAKTRAMPAQNRLRLDDREGIQNTRRDPIQADENQAIEGAQDRSLQRPSAQYVQLMAQSQVLGPKRCSRPKQPDEHPPDQIEQIPHALFMARFGASRQADWICDRDNS